MEAANRDLVFRIKHSRNVIPPGVLATSFKLASTALKCFSDPAESLHDPVWHTDFGCSLWHRSSTLTEGGQESTMASTATSRNAVSDLRQTLAQRILKIAPKPGEHATTIPELWLYHRTTPTPCYRASYEPGLSVFVGGRKRIILGGAEYLCDGTSFLLSSIDVPAQSQIIEATPQKPLVTLFLKLDMPAVREVVSQEEQLPERRSPHKQGLAVGETTEGLLNSCLRLLDLLETPEDIRFLSPMVQREIVYRVLRTPQAGRLRAIATSGDLSQRTARAIAWLRANYAKPLRMEDLADTARMGVSTLHHQFRALTTMSPLQYQKQLRLETARQRMLMDGLDATSAAYEVGYESVSQFSREYVRLFGQPPIRDIKALREGMYPGAMSPEESRP